MPHSIFQSNLLSKKYMEEIKFRGLDINKNLHIGLLAESAGFPGQPEKGVYISNTVGMPWAYQVRVETVCQYTGLKDKNGKEIYEGDIVQMFSHGDQTYPTVKAKVKYKAPEFIFDYGSEIQADDCCIVIGNIYENPEILSNPTQVEKE